MKRTFWPKLGGAGIVCMAASLAVGQPTGPYSLHGEQQQYVVPDGAKEGAPAGKAPTAKAVSPAVAEDTFVVMGYVQTDTPRWGFHWHALTHVCLPFTTFDSNGDLLNPTSSVTGRSIIYKPGGMAERHGVKVLMTLANSGFDENILDAVMQSTTLRQQLADEVAALINNPSDNIAGVNLDFEPIGATQTATRQGFVDFIVYLRSVLNPGKEISWYVGPTYVASHHPNLPTAVANLDFVNISCYPYSGTFSSTSTSITPLSGYDGNVDAFFNAGVPPEKMVLTLGTYGHRMETASTAYGASKIGDIGSTGYGDAKFEVTLASPPATRQYQTGVESPWYTRSLGSTFEHCPYEDEYSLDLKMRGALSWQGAVNSGRQLRGVGFWSLGWLANDFLGGFDSRDMEAGTGSVDKIRTYPQIYQLMQEIFAPPGQTEFLIEKWEYYDVAIGSSLQSDWDRWRDPTEGADDVGVSSATRSIVSKPGGSGAPANSDYCLRIDHTFTATAGNKFLYRWEILGDVTQTSVRDFNATSSFFDATTKVMADVYTPAAYSGRTIRIAVLDEDGEVELGPALSLNATGWRTLEWDLTASTPTGYNTSFNQYFDGDGTLDTAGGGARDLAVIGFLVEGGGAAGSGSIYLDELRWTHVNAGGLDYKINEFAVTNDDGEFVEIYGPPGVIPAGVALRTYDSTDASVAATFSLAGLTVPASGILAVGDPAVSGTTAAAGFGNAVDDLPDTAPGSIQLVNTSTGGVYDSAVYLAFGGLDHLSWPDTKGVTAEGWPWMGEIGPGSYSVGRYPDGQDTNINNADFAVQPLSPGAANGGSIGALPQTFDFDATIPPAYDTYEWASAGVVASGVGASPDGGNVYRVADSSGGVLTFIGDKELGSNGQGYRVTGEMYIQPAAGRAQAMGIGICGTHGSVFFTGDPTAYGYENGYWLIYQNNSGVTLANGFNNGRANHAGTFEFIHATHDNMDGTPVALLGSATRASTGAAEGAWTTFELSIDPVGNVLTAKINGSTIFSGPIPAGGPIQGAFQAGHRETATGANTATDGTWLDNIQITPINTGVNGWVVIGRD